jgi:hypothetical protein
VSMNSVLFLSTWVAVNHTVDASSLGYVVNPIPIMKAPAKHDSARTSSSAKRIVYIRHAESAWNASVKDVAQLLGGFSTDSPLSRKGIQQSQSLAAWIDNAPEGQCVSGDSVVSSDDASSEASCDNASAIRSMMLSDSTVWVSSNLKRALLTGVIALRSKLVSGPPPVVNLLSALQEVSMGIDAQASVGAREIPDVGWSEVELFRVHADDNVGSMDIHIDVSNNIGNMNSVVAKVSSADRIRDFCNWLNTQQSNDIVVVGHSTWLNEFFAASNLAVDGLGFFEDLNSAEIILTEGRAKLGNASVLYFESVSVGAGCAFVPGKTQLVFGNWQKEKSFKKTLSGMFDKSRKLQDEIPISN